MTSQYFDYHEAFSRNIGLVQPKEQEALRAARIGIAGLGGVGGIHLLTLARMGFGHFHIADFDTFEIHNINRQAGATCSTLGRTKVEVMRAMVLDINPTAEINIFPEGISRENVNSFLSGVDVAIDGLDYFALEARDIFYSAAREKKIPVVAAGPLGASSALLVFLPGGMSWHEYFSMNIARDEVDRYILFAIGTAPRALHMPYLDRSYVDLKAKKGPSLALAVQLCAGMVAAETMKLVLKSGKILSAPYFQQFDAYRCKYVIGKLRWGNRGPLQRAKLKLFRKLLK